MKRPTEPLSQRHLVYALRYAVDTGKALEARSLMNLHPRAMRAREVLRGLGARRRELLGLDDAGSFARSSDVR